MSTKVAIYCRLSEEDKNKQNANDDSGSIQNQKAMLRDYSATMGWEIYDVYSDDDYTGADRNRPEFRRLLEDAEHKKFDIVLCKTLSRFTREIELVEKYIHGLFPRWGIRFVSIVDHSDTDIKGNKKSRQVNALFNEWYLEDMSNSIRAALDSRRKNGFHIGAFALYGYEKDPNQKGHLIVDEEAASVVKEVFSLFAQGYGKTAIARILNDKGIPNPTEYKRRKGLRYHPSSSVNSTLWRYPAISSMLTNELYVGNMVQGKHENISYKIKGSRSRIKERWFVVENTHEPIIDRELWDRVQRRIAERAKPFVVGMIGLFAKKVRCACCGYTLRSSKNRGKHYLQCANRHVAKDSCEGAFISVNRLEQIVIAELNRLSAEYLDKDALEQNLEFCTNLKESRKVLEADILTYQKRCEEYTKGLRELYMDKIKGVVTEDDFRALSQNIHTERDQLEHWITEAEKQLVEIDRKIAAGDNRREIIEQYVNPTHLTREMVDTLIDHITVGKRLPGMKVAPIKIYWNF